MTATLFTGLFWELWNYYSLPKWYYTIPYVDFWRVFEMPILGYAGYPFFGMVVVSYSIAVFSVVRWNLIALLTHRFRERFDNDEFWLTR